MSEERRLGEIGDYDGLIAVICERMTSVGITHETLEAFGFAKGHVGKVLAPNHTKNLGPLSFGMFMRFLGIRLVAFEDKKTTEKMRPYWQKRKKAKPLLTAAS